MSYNLQLLIDNQEIRDLLTRYGYSLDDKDYARLATCFTPDAVFHFGPELGQAEGFAKIKESVSSVLERLDSTQHIITNHEINVEGDSARTRCYLFAQHTKAGTPGGDNFTIGGQYVDELVRTPQGWRIKKRQLQSIWQEGNIKVLWAE